MIGVSKSAIDVFAHVLPPKFYQQLLQLAPELPQKYPFIKMPALSDLTIRQAHFDGRVKQVISNVNLNPEDYTDPTLAAKLCQSGNEELIELVKRYPAMFVGAVAMVPLNNLEATAEILEQVKKEPKLLGIQLFTRALGKSIADPAFYPVFEKVAALAIPIWLHPVFDERKPDNNIVFSWEYELTQAMLQLVQSDIFTKYPQLKIIVHHAGGMVPYFAERIEHILSAEQTKAFKKFYVDTALLGNHKALELAVAYYGSDHVLFGTDAPLGIAPVGPTKEITAALQQANLTSKEREQIMYLNFEKLMAGDAK